MKHKEFIDKRIGKSVDVDHAYWSQCVDWTKFYIQQVYGITQWTYWWSALTGRYNQSNTFPSDTWIRVVMDRNPNYSMPQQWDVVFWWATATNPYWHVAIVHSAWPSWLVVIEQNAGNGNWDWKGDNAIRKQQYDYTNVLWFYRNRLASFYSEQIPVTENLQRRLSPSWSKNDCILTDLMWFLWREFDRVENSNKYRILWLLEEVANECRRRMKNKQ